MQLPRPRPWQILIALAGAAALVGLDRAWAPRDIEINHAYRGTAYGARTAESDAAIRLLARTEGILVDPVYSGKALAGLIDGARRAPTSELVFWHTGGVPALFDPRYGDPLVRR